MPLTQTAEPQSSKNAKGVTASPPEQQESATPVAPAMTTGDAEKREVLIRIAAYSFYERRGYICGHELEDWLEAEMEIDRQMDASPDSTGTT